MNKTHQYSGTELRQLWVEMHGRNKQQFADNPAEAELRRTYSEEQMDTWLLEHNGCIDFCPGRDIEMPMEPYRRAEYLKEREKPGPDKKYPLQIHLRVDDETKAALELLCEKRGEDASTTIRNLILLAAMEYQPQETLLDRLGITAK